MKKKIVGIFVCMMLISTVLPATGTFNEKNMTSTGEIESIPVLEFKNISRGIIKNLLGFSVELTNSGDGATGKIEWSMNISGGLYDIPLIKKLFVPKSMTEGEIDSLEPGDNGTIKIGPILLALPGRFNINFNCTYTIYTMTNLLRCDDCEADVTVLQEYVDKGLLILHTFPEGQQPVIEWKNITEHTYIGGGMVNLWYEGPPPNILQYHNVRVWNPIPGSGQVEFLGSCSFINGNGTIKECNITYDIVEHGPGYWQVQLVNGQ